LTDKKRDRWKDRQTDRMMHKLMDGQAGRQSAKRVVRLTNGQRDKKTNGLLEEWTDKQSV
jgi:hypothetical protein